jgi:D-alanine-D-alanine ligase
MHTPLIVLFGGPSEERLVSVATTQNLISHLPEARPWFVDRDLRIYDLPKEELLAHQRPFSDELRPAAPPSAATLEAAIADVTPETVFFLGMHGSWGEDGTVQRLLEERGLAFTGSGSRASADAFDKSAAKRIAAARGVRTAEAQPLPQGDAAKVYQALAAMLARCGRVVAKPLAGGSSVGLHHVRSPQDAERAAGAIASSGEAYLCEAFVSGTELTVGVVDGAAGRRALPVSEVRIDPGRAFDYEGKYLGKGTVEITPAEVAPEISRAAQQLALTVHDAIGCYGYTRTDVIVDAQGPVFLETNTLPGLTRASFIPQQLAAEGTPLRNFLEEQIALARRRG